MTSHCSCSKSVVLLTLQYPPCYISYAWQMTPNLCMLQIHSQCIQNVIICIQNYFMYKSLTIFNISGRICSDANIIAKFWICINDKFFGLTKPLDLMVCQILSFVFKFGCPTVALLHFEFTIRFFLFPNSSQNDNIVKGL